MGLNNQEIKLLDMIENKYYMKPIMNLIQDDLHNNIIPVQEIFNNLYDYLTSANKKIKELLTESILKEKYNISYNPPILPLVCFATVNFYNEINNPQHRGMFKFLTVLLLVEIFKHNNS